MGQIERIESIKALLNRHGLRYLDSGIVSAGHGIMLRFTEKAVVTVYTNGTVVPGGPPATVAKIKEILNSVEAAAEAVPVLANENRMVFMQDLTVREAQKESADYAIANGFRDNQTFLEIFEGPDVTITGKRYAALLLREKLLKIVTEVTEIDEALTKGTLFENCDKYAKGCLLSAIAEESADGPIRYFDLADFMDVDSQDAIIRKQAFNRTRPFRHGNQN